MDHLWAMKNQLDTRELMMLESELRNQSKNMAVAYLLWWFLGIFGAHRFYLGKIGSAVTMLILTLTVVGLLITVIWWLVDVLLTHGNVEEHNRKVESQLIGQLQMAR